MSSIFYDRLIVLEEIETEVKRVSRSSEERDELWGFVDEIVHHKIMGCILDKLPLGDHAEFLEKFQKAPYDEGLISFLTKKIGADIEEFIKTEVTNLKNELLKEI